MKATIDRKTLAKALTAAYAAVPKRRSTLPALEGFLLRAENHHLTITGNNLEQAVICRVPATITKVGSAVVPAKALLGTITNSKEDSVALSVTGKALQVTAGRATSKLEGSDPKDYPPVPRAPRSMKPINGLLEAMHQVAFAAATDQSRLVLTTVAIMPTDKGTDVATADGFRLAVHSLKGKYPKALVPRETVLLAHKLLQGQDDVRMAVSEGSPPRLFFQAGDTTIVSQLVEGTFPNYTLLIPKDGTPLYFKIGVLPDVGCCWR